MTQLILDFRRPLIVLLHVGLIVLANFLAFWLKYGPIVPDPLLGRFVDMVPWLVVIRGLTFIPFRLYEGLWRYAGIYDLRNIIGGVVVIIFQRWRERRTKLKAIQFECYMKLLELKQWHFWLLACEMRGETPKPKFVEGFDRARLQVADEIRKAEIVQSLPEGEQILKILFSLDRLVHGIGDNAQVCVQIAIVWIVF